MLGGKKRLFQLGLDRLNGDKQYLFSESDYTTSDHVIMQWQVLLTVIGHK